METKSIASVFFTGAGTTKEVVARICDKLGGCDRRFDITPHASSVDYAFNPGDIAVIGVPSYGGRVPAPAVEKIEACQGNGALAVLVVTYGNRAIDDTLIELADAAERAGFVVAAAGAFVAHHSLMTDVALDRPDERDRADIDDFADRVFRKVEQAANAESVDRVELPGKRPYKEFGGVSFTVKTVGGCTSCGICARVCPTGAIPEENPSLTDASRCIACMRCVHECRLGGRAIKGLAYWVAKRKFARKLSSRQGSLMYL
ncbi:MAG: 4Fe-4S binding protein [Slackia sp.]|nr:4Fe-4S binding protein [Slackia sp.]